MPRIKIKQHDITDCGPACLASIAAYYDLELPLARIRQYCGTDQKGTSVLGLLEASKKLGFEGKAVRGDFQALFQIPKPAIAHVVIDSVFNHYVVLLASHRKYLRIMDPSDGRIHRMSHSGFQEIWTGVLILLQPAESFTSGSERIPKTRRFWALLKPHKWILLQALIGAICYTLLGLSTSIYIQKLTDFVFINENTRLLNLMGIIMGVLLVFQVMIGVYKDIFLIRSGQQIDARLILGYYKHLLRLPQTFFDTMRVGEIISRINDAVKIRNFINGVSLNLSVNVLIIIFSFALMFSYYWKLGLIMLGIIPLYFGLYTAINRLNKKTERRIMEGAAKLENHLVESLQTVKTIKLFGLEAHANLGTETRFVALLQTGYISALNAIFSSTSARTTTALFTILLLWCGSYFVIQREITPGELMSFYAIVGYFTGPAASLIAANRDIQNALIAADRLFEIMDLEVQEQSGNIILDPSQLGDIRFEQVCFQYNPHSEVFRDLTLTFQQARITGVIGESGSGKSTVFALLQNLYPIQSGSIYIGNHNLKYLDPRSLQKVMTVVPQKVDLFAGNIVENIAVGDLNPNMKKLIAICRKLDILDFIEALPQGFKTYLGENGAQLSGGQKQRIAFARALYMEPEILLLDEATSSLDSGAEQYIQNVIYHLRKTGKTVIFIAHRLSSLLHADKIVVMKKGKVVEEGSHEDLYGAGGLYYNMWQQQLPIRKNTNETPQVVNP